MFNVFYCKCIIHEFPFCKENMFIIRTNPLPSTMSSALALDSPTSLTAVQVYLPASCNVT